MRLAIIGLGLIGGSIARAIRSGPADSPIESIVAWSPTGSGPAAALSNGVIDRAAASLADALDGAGLVVLATDPLSCLELLDAIAATDFAVWQNFVVPVAAPAENEFVHEQVITDE